LTVLVVSAFSARAVAPIGATISSFAVRLTNATPQAATIMSGALSATSSAAVIPAFHPFAIGHTAQPLEADLHPRALSATATAAIVAALDRLATWCADAERFAVYACHTHHDGEGDA